MCLVNNMNSFRQWVKTRTYPTKLGGNPSLKEKREYIGEQIGKGWRAIQTYELGDRDPTLGTKLAIERVSGKAVPVWSWDGWQVFVYKNADTWPAPTDDYETYDARGLEATTDTDTFRHFAIQHAEDWKEWGITHYRVKGNDNG